MNKQKFIKVGILLVLIGVCVLFKSYLGLPLVLFATVDLAKSLTAIRKKGALNWAYKRVNADGTDLTSADTWHDGVYRKSSEIGFDQALETDELEDGSETDGEDGPFKGDLQITSAQDDANTMKFLKDEVQGKYFAVIMHRGKGKDNKELEIFIPIVRIARSYSSVSGTRKPVIKMKYLYNDAAVTPATVPTWAKALPAAFVCAAGGYFAPVET